MRKSFFFLFGLFFLVIISYQASAQTTTASADSSAGNISGEATSPISAESSVAPSGEAIQAMTAEAAVSSEVTAPASIEPSSLPSAPGIVPTAETTASQEEGASYKGVPWGADFSKFKTIKNYPGNLGSSSSGFVGNTEDNDIALLLGTPVAEQGPKRVMFELVPQKFASVYFEPDDVFYIFYDGKFAMAFSTIMEKNIDLYRDNFYKKYKRIGNFSKAYALSAAKKYKVEAIKFEKGRTWAFLVRSTTEDKAQKLSSAKVLFAYSNIFSAIQEEIKTKAAVEKVLNKAKDEQSLEKDLKKIE